MRTWSWWLCVAVTLGAALEAVELGAEGEALEAEELEAGLDNSLDDDKGNYVKHLQDQCAAKQVVACLKLSLYRGLERLSHRPQLELLPGLTVAGDMTSLQDLSQDVARGTLDEEVLTRCLTRYLSSLSVTVKVLDGSVVRRIREMGEALMQAPEDNAVIGRRKRFGSHMMMASMMSGGSMMALAMTAITMMAGKALMMSLLSLMMTGMMTMGKGSSGGGGQTTYEIIHGHDIKHRSMEPVAADTTGYPYLVPQALRRNLVIPLHRR